MSKTLKQRLIYQGKMIKMKRCKYCYSTENLTIDHKIPKIQGGTDDVKNLQCLCFPCNGMKSGFSHKQLQNIYRWLRECENKRMKKCKCQHDIDHICNLESCYCYEHWRERLIKEKSKFVASEIKNVLDKLK